MAIVSSLTAVSLATRLLGERKLSLPLMWEAGFLSVVSFEAATTTSTLPSDLSEASFDLALKVLIVGHAIVVVVADTLILSGSAREVAISWRPKRLGVPATAAVSVGAVLYLLPMALMSLRDGRTATFGDAGPISALADSAGILAPTLIALLIRDRATRRGLGWAFIASLPVLMAQLLVGTRYMLLLSAMGLLIVMLGPKLDTMRVRMSYLALGLLLMVASTAMVANRNSGGFSLQALSDSIVAPSLSNEGVVISVARLVEYFASHDHLLGSSAASVFVFLIPRAVWVDKPTLIGHWFPREYGLTGFSESHSISFAYVADGYADFGLAGVFLYGLVIGLVVGYGQRFGEFVFSQGDSYARGFAALCLPAAYFAVRSPVTAMITLVGVAVILLFLRSFSPPYSPTECSGRVGQGRR